MWALLFYVFVVQESQCLKKVPRATTENGVVVGTYQVSEGGVEYQAFLGVPYAKPPVDDRRFKEPQRLDDSWIGEYNSTLPPSSCLQLDQFSRSYNKDGTWSYDVVGDEDCLFLNVFTRDTSKKNQDVIVNLHWGAFMFGSGYFSSPRYLFDHGEIVYVSVNYRLGPLGFLTTGDSIVPGNNGLKDQVAALEWVQRNIEGFGGDRKKVTIIGLSAGGVSVHYHYLSPLSYGLFNRGWSFSGTTLAPWALVTNGVERSTKLAEYMGCPTTDSRLMLKCLRRRPARQIVQRTANFQKWLYNPFTVFGPVVEVDAVKPFLDRDPLEIMKSGGQKDLPWVTTVTSSEGLYPAAEFAWSQSLLNDLDQKWEELAPSLLFYDEADPRSSEIAALAKESYLSDQNISIDTRNDIVRLLSERLFVSSAVQSAKLQAEQNTQNVYFYYFDYKGNSTLSPFRANSDFDLGVCHGDDFMYILGPPEVDTGYTEADRKIRKWLVDVLLKFVTTGKILKETNWKPVSQNIEDELTFLDIKSPEDIKMTHSSTLGNLQVWGQIFGHKNNVKEEL